MCQTDYSDHCIVFIFLRDIVCSFFLFEFVLNMTNEKLTEQNQNSLLSKRLLIPGQHQHDFGNNETKPTKINSASSQIMNIKNPSTAFSYISTFRPIPFDTS